MAYKTLRHRILLSFEITGNSKKGESFPGNVHLYCTLSNHHIWIQMCFTHRTSQRTETHKFYKRAFAMCFIDYIKAFHRRQFCKSLMYCGDNLVVLHPVTWGGAKIKPTVFPWPWPWPWPCKRVTDITTNSIYTFHYIRSPSVPQTVLCRMCFWVYVRVL